MSTSYAVAIVGATGAVGREMLRVLEQRRFPCGQVTLLASHRSAGRRLPFRDGEIEVRELDDAGRAFEGVRIALFSAGAQTSLKYAPLAARAGAVVIDNSSAFRMDPDVPLVVPEVNFAAALDRPRGIIANPNCSTIQLVVVLGPLRAAAGLRRVVVSTYQAVSGAGARALAELDRQTRDDADGRIPTADVLPFPIHGNLLFHDVKDPSGYTEEELKIVHETRKILGDAALRITATCVRVPVRVAHSEAAWVELERPMTVAQARALLARSPGIEVVDEPAARRYPLPRELAGTDAVFVGRVREDASVPGGLAMWIVADNLRKGAALNAVQIAERLVVRGL
ncbi:MAG: aspartate-semialdehyde dehydrogenase [Myxococcota bacterium]